MWLYILFNAGLEVYGESGEVVVAAVGHPLEDPSAATKRRPAILLERHDGRWWLMGLTSKPTYRDGQPRTPISNPDALGLTGPGYLWGRPTHVSALDVHTHIGWADEPTADLLARVLGPQRVPAATLLGEAPQLSA
jgi:hypothetical protein